MELTKIREQLDTIDSQLLILLTIRMKLMPLVAQYKHANKLDIEQPQREKELLQIKREFAKENELNPDFVENLFKLIMDEGKRIQRNT